MPDASNQEKNMSEMYELNDAELDAVAAGAGAGAGAGGVVAAAVAAAIDTIDIDVLNDSLKNFRVSVIEGDVTVENVASGNNVGLGVLVNVLGLSGLGIGQNQ